jgi:hypothetical protein
LQPYNKYRIYYNNFINTKKQKKKKTSKNVNVPVPIYVKDERQKLWAKMPQPNPKVDQEARHNATNHHMLQNPKLKLETIMPSERIHRVSQQGYQHHQGESRTAVMAVTPPYLDAKPVPEQGHQPNKELEDPIIIANIDFHDEEMNKAMVMMQITME